MIFIIDFNYFVVYIAKYLKLTIMAIIKFSTELILKHPEALTLVSDTFGEMIEISTISDLSNQIRVYSINVDEVDNDQQICFEIIRDENDKLKIIRYYS